MTSSTKTTQRKKTVKAKPRVGSKTVKAKSGVTRKGKDLVIVESPAKARTIEKILGNGFTVKASQGHVRDLPKWRLGVDVDQEFSPTYSIIKDKQTIVRELKDLGERARSIYLATDPDREGEAISWHLVKAAGWDKRDDSLHRVVFHEITPQAIQEAFKHPRLIDMELVNAQQARRILDRLVGYEISPLLWRKVQRGLSAGRVQSVALRMVVDREGEIGRFVPIEYWTIKAQLRKQLEGRGDAGPPFTALLHSVSGHRGKLNIPDKSAADRINGDLEDARYAVARVDKKERKQSPSPPFITSTLQQEAGRKLRFTAKKTMAVAQQLYEGLAIGAEGSIGLITYMRTDSTNVASQAIQEARKYLQVKFGKEYLPGKPRFFRKRSKGAQEAHEAIRPTSAFREPAAIRPHLTNDQYRLYDLVWRRMIASQAADALYDSTTVDSEASCRDSSQVYLFRATGSVLRFPGFRALYMESKDDDDEEEREGTLPELAKGDGLDCLGIESGQHFTQPPPRFTEATLIKALEENGIGRPSTYAPIVSTIMDRHYVVKDQGRLKPTTLGDTVSGLLTQYFSDIVETGFTAKMEEGLDEVARGEREWVPMLSDFYGPFAKSLEVATQDMPRVKVEEATDEVCNRCGKPMVIKTGRFGRFMACSNYPECKNTKPLEGGGEEATDEVCGQCGQPMTIKMGRFGRFIACTNYPTCKNTRPLLEKVGVACPRCGGDLVQRKSRGKGRSFYGCSRYPDCDFLVNQKPLTEPCPECSGLMVQSGKSGTWCTRCSWKGELEEKEPAVADA